MAYIDQKSLGDYQAQLQEVANRRISQDPPPKKPAFPSVKMDDVRPLDTKKLLDQIEAARSGLFRQMERDIVARMQYDADLSLGDFEVVTFQEDPLKFELRLRTTDDGIAKVATVRTYRINLVTRVEEDPK